MVFVVVRDYFQGGQKWYLSSSEIVSEGTILILFIQSLCFLEKSANISLFIFFFFLSLQQIMATIIYPAPIFGPVKSRRLGISLGINLMPADGKVCTFDCIYCECGFNKDFRPRLPRPTREEVAEALEHKLREMAGLEQAVSASSVHLQQAANIPPGVLPDVLTFAGNGEPTAHPHFAEIIDDTLRLRDKYCPDAKVSVLSNATMLHKDSVRQALMRVDNNILKLDTINPDYINKVDRPTGRYDVDEVVSNMKLFSGHLIIQTMFLKGMSGGENVDNTGDEYIAPWLEVVNDIRPQSVMIYTIDRETPDHNLLKATHEELDAIKQRVEALGIPCTASY
jgi:wyosine [tRNA(Phe)-imidazoG37] synthetase (radical SAM superfamily)